MASPARPTASAAQRSVTLMDVARRVIGRVVRQIENGPDTEAGEIVTTWLREGESTPVRR